MHCDQLYDGNLSGSSQGALMSPLFGSRSFRVCGPNLAPFRFQLALVQARNTKMVWRKAFAMLVAWPPRKPTLRVWHLRRTAFQLVRDGVSQESVRFFRWTLKLIKRFSDVQILCRPKPIRTISGVFGINEQIRIRILSLRKLYILKDSNFWCVHVNVPWPGCAHAIPFRMLWLP